MSKARENGGVLGMNGDSASSKLILADTSSLLGHVAARTGIWAGVPTFTLWMASIAISVTTAATMQHFGLSAFTALPLGPVLTIIV